MNLQPVTGPPLSFKCVACEKSASMTHETVFADLDGKAFTDYYCGSCAKAISKPTRELGCCCCGGYTRGRQWFNRDTGYGICPACIEFVKKHGETPEEIRDNYGIKGIHYDVEQTSDLREILGEALREDGTQ